MSDELRALLQRAEELKCDLWGYMDAKNKLHKGVRCSMNELLDLIEEIDEYGGDE